METLTILPERVYTQTEFGEHTILHRKMSCTCGWEGLSQAGAAEAMAKHHLNFKHGGGRYVYEGIIEDI